MSFSPAFREALRRPGRRLAWLFWIERDGDDVHAWSGLGPLSWDGQTWQGAALVSGMDAIRRTSALEHVRQDLKLSGVDPSLVTDLDGSVRGLSTKVWLAVMNASQQVAGAWLAQVLEQDTLNWEAGADGRLTLTLGCYAALPKVGRIDGSKWGREAQLEAVSGDEGFYYNDQVARARGLMDWRAAT